MFVFWQVPDELALPSHAALLAGRLDDPAITRSGHTMSIMIDAVTRLLIENNFAVEDAAHVNDLRALQILSQAGWPVTAGLSLGGRQPNRARPDQGT